MSPPSSAVAAVVHAAFVLTSVAADQPMTAQSISLGLQGRGMFMSVESNRVGADASFPMNLSFYAEETGMMTYQESRGGLVLTFRLSAWDPTTHDAFLSLDWDAKADGYVRPATAAAVLRVDQTSCGAQMNVVELFHQDCHAQNTPGGCDAECYCAVSPCTLEESEPGNATAFLGKTLQGGSPDITPLKLKPNPADPSPDAKPLLTQVFRLTPLTTALYEESSFTMRITIKSAAVVLRPVSKVPQPQPKPIAGSHYEDVCYGKSRMRARAAAALKGEGVALVV